MGSISKPTLESFRTEPLKSGPNRGAIVLVHGFTGAASKTWKSFADRLRNDGELKSWDIAGFTYRTEFLPDLVGIWSANADIATLVTLLITECTQGGLKDYGALAIIAHSMGGLIAQKAIVESEALRDRSSHLIMFGTPSAGVGKAGWASKFVLKRQFRDMHPKSDFITKLREDWNKRVGANPRFRLVVVAGAEDEFVPRVSSLPPFDARFHAIVPGNHSSMLEGSDSMVNLVRSVLTDAGPSLGKGDSVASAIELLEYRRLLHLLDHPEELDVIGLSELCRALEAHGDEELARKLLQAGVGSFAEDPKVLGMLGGRLKSRWLSEYRKADADRALDLYGRAFTMALANNDPLMACYGGINRAFLELVYLRTPMTARATAELVLQQCERAEASQVSNVWLPADHGEALLHLRNTAAALMWYSKFLASDPNLWTRGSTYRQAKRIAAELNDKTFARDLAEMFGYGRTY